jgi:hypothetical protein
VPSIDRRIELWTYKRFDNDVLQLEPAFGWAPSELFVRSDGKDPVMVAKLLRSKHRQVNLPVDKDSDSRSVNKPFDGLCVARQWIHSHKL